MIIYDYGNHTTHSLDVCYEYYTEDYMTRANDLLLLQNQEVPFDKFMENCILSKLFELESKSESTRFIIAKQEDLSEILSIMNSVDIQGILIFDRLGYTLDTTNVNVLKQYNKQRKFTLPITKHLEILKQLSLINDIMTYINVPPKQELNEYDLVHLIRSYINNDGKVHIFLNEGNGGDALIALGTYHLLRKHSINYKIIQNYQDIKQNDRLIYGGGGNLVSHYMHCENFLKSFKKHKILILPHTIDKTDLLGTLKDNVTIVTRDLTSYYNCKIHFKYKSYISHDMAFYIDLSLLPKVIRQNHYVYANCFRNDVERTVVNIPNNIDISDRINYDRYMKNENLVEKTVIGIFNYLINFDVVNTNRLHMCIAGYLLQKQVEFYNNSYWKNNEVYKYSLRHCDLINFHHS